RVAEALIRFGRLRLVRATLAIEFASGNLEVQVLELLDANQSWRSNAYLQQSQEELAKRGRSHRRDSPAAAVSILTTTLNGRVEWGMFLYGGRTTRGLPAHETLAVLLSLPDLGKSQGCSCRCFDRSPAGSIGQSGARPRSGPHAT